MRIIEGMETVQNQFPEMLRDESRLSGRCDRVLIPATPEDASEAMSSGQCTISGARTGITGGAVPFGGSVVSTVNLQGITRITEDRLLVASGETIQTVRDFCDKVAPEYFYPPDPTETTASIGGTVATDASGACGYLYGSTRNWVNAITVVLQGGIAVGLSRGEHRFIEGICAHPVLGEMQLPLLRRLQPEKNAAGLFIRRNMDLVDLFIGSEGHLGLITSAELVLAPKPAFSAEIAVFCDENCFWEVREGLIESQLRVRSLEMMDGNCLTFLAGHAGSRLPASRGWVLITGFVADSNDELDDSLQCVEKLLDRTGVAETWAALEQKEKLVLQEFRHLLPETVNRVVAENAAGNPEVHKVGTDAAVPPSLLRNHYCAMKRILSDSKVPYVVFGHSGQGHLHANLLPGSVREQETAERAAEAIALAALELGGTVSAEHGTGKLKQHLLEAMYSPEELRGMYGILGTQLRNNPDPSR